MIPLVLTMLGLVLGSFVDALVWRLHEQERLATRKASAKKAAAKNLSILTGRSMCETCHHTLAAKDLVPVASWLLLKGKCRYCRAPIAWQDPLLELLAAGLFIVSYIWWPFGFNAGGIFDFCLWLIFLTAFLALAVYDLRWFLLPDRIVYPLIGLAVVKVLADAVLFGGGINAALQAGLAAICVAGLFYVLHRVSRGTWIGFGDVKLAIVLGLLAGRPSQALLLIFVASLLGTAAAVPLLIRGRAKITTRVPFGPFLLAAAVVVVLFGGDILRWYSGLLYLG